MPPTVFHNQKCPFITNLVLGKVEKENHIREVLKSEERKFKNIGKNHTIIRASTTILERAKTYPNIGMFLLKTKSCTHYIWKLLTNDLL